MDFKAKSAQRPRVLSIDNSEANRRWIEKTLASAFEVRTTKSGTDCLSSVHAFAPDIILLDVDLPNPDNFKVCQQIRADKDFATTPILFLSHLINQNDQIKGFQAGVDEYIVKPIDADKLVSTLELSLERAHKKLAQKEESEAYPTIEQNIRSLHEYLLTLISHNPSHTLPNLTLNTLEKFGLKGAIYWHDTGETYSSVGPLTDLEHVLLKQATQSFPVDHSARFVWGCHTFGAIIHNMPSTRSNQYQTMRQIVSTLFRATESKARTNAQSAPQSQNFIKASSELAVDKLDTNALYQLSVNLEATIASIENQSEQQLQKITQQLQELASDTNRAEKDRQLLQQMLNQSIQIRIAIYDQCLELQSQHQALARLLDEAQSKEQALVE